MLPLIDRKKKLERDLVAQVEAFLADTDGQVMIESITVQVKHGFTVGGDIINECAARVKLSL